MTWLRWLLQVVTLLAIAGGCADSGPPLGGVDGGPPDGSGMEDATVDAPITGCPAGQHMCATGCVDDQPNRPDQGCMNGCGEPCATPMNARATCTDAGECSSECIPPAVSGPDGCSCAALTCEDLGFTCGMADDMCGGTLSCGMCGDGATCVDNQCGCAPDAAEMNEERATASDLGSLDDSNDETQTFMEYNIHEPMDADWFRYAVNDGSDGGNPIIRIDLQNIPTGANYDLFAWYVCGSGTDATDCGAGAPDTTLGSGCRSDATGNTSEAVRLDTDCEQIGFDDSGTLYIRVTPVSTVAMCTPYTLIVAIN